MAAQHLQGIVLPVSMEHIVFKKLGSGDTKSWKEKRKSIYQELLSTTNPIHSGTLDSFGQGPILHNKTYDLSLVDEAGQATEPAILPVANSCKRLCLVGDQEQLSPSSNEVLMQRSLLERLSSTYGFEIVMLEIQYRMLPEIAAWPSYYFYGEQLQSARPPATRKDLIPGFAWP